MSDKKPCPDTVIVRRGLLVALSVTASALCRKVNAERIAHCRAILKKLDEEVFETNTPREIPDAVRERWRKYKHFADMYIDMAFYGARMAEITRTLNDCGYDTKELER